jgi:hypothetical protein
VVRVEGGDDCSMAVVVLVDGDVEVGLGRVVDGCPDLALVDALARMQLVAGRMGCSIRLREPCPKLLELLEFAGLADLLVDD